MSGLFVNLMEQASQVFMDLQTELIFFLLAIGTHLLFFNRFTLRMTSLKAKVKEAPSKQQRGKSSESLSAFRSALRAGDINAALSHFQSLNDLWHQRDSPSSAPNMLLEQLVKLAGQNGKLAQLADLVKEVDLLDKTFDLLLTESVQQGNTTALKKVEELGRSEAIKFSSATYQALMKGATASGSIQEAHRIMQEAQNGGLADINLYTVYMKALLQKSSIRDVQKVMKTVKSEGLQMHIIHFNSLLTIAVSSGGDQAWTIFQEMKTFNVKPDTVTCSILLKGLKSKAYNLEMVVGIMDGLEGDVDEVLINSVVEASIRAGRSDLLVPFLKKQRSSKRLVIKTAHTYSSIIRACGYVQDIEAARDTWHQMRRQHIAPISVTLGCMVEALVTNGDIEGGYELIQEMLSDEKTASLVNAVMYGSIVKGFSHKKNFDRVWQVYDEMRERKLQFSMVTYNTLIDACARSGDLGRIPSLLKDIDAQGLKMGIVTYSAILKGYCQKNKLDDAFQLLEDMKRTTKLEPDEIMYNTLLDGCARQGLYDRGMALLARMKKSGVPPSNFTLSVLVKLANRGKKLEEAFEICEDLSKKHGFRLNVHVYANLVQACIQHHDVPRAIAVLERMIQERVRPDLRTYSLLLRACIDTRAAKDAAGLLRAATGLRGVHTRLEQYPAAGLQPQGGLPGDVISEILFGIMVACGDERLAASLFVDLSRLPGVKLDPKLRHRLTARMADL